VKMIAVAGVVVRRQHGVEQVRSGPYSVYAARAAGRCKKTML
jgi:hypothetical protein